MSETGWRPWLPEAVAAFLVLAVGLTETFLTATVFAAPDGLMFANRLAFEGVAQALVVALAVGLCRRAPGVALALVWGLGLYHVTLDAPIMVAEFALTAVFFGGARWGRPPTVVMSAVSVPLAVVVAFFMHEGRVLTLQLLLGGSKLGGILSLHPTVQLVLSLVGLLAVAAPWPAGLVMRFLERATDSRAAMLAAEEDAAGARRATEHAREIAQLRDQQTRLARDVHDVVGHSLAVILAQAESGQYLDENERLKKTLRTIAISARSSLQDVRQVLSTTQDTAPETGDAGQLDGLIEGVRGSGHQIIATELGTPRALPRETATVAYRVLQEMLTNAIKHGRRDQPITAERHWPSGPAGGGFADTLRIEVTNTRAADGSGSGAGRGLEGMRRRLETINGHLDVRSREQAAGTTFTVTAYLPLLGGS
ncbi:sensor histidine kinase [Hamadaea tsunoensis]|uniref:sensor histidine kinase n=1 Tax=Hamadaea tsunoensis TaxID=53368 RepID=UPI000420BF68|nr:histidine kinase [Hamadaea tsunoensis]